MYIPYSNENEHLSSGTFTHQYYTPKRHIPPGNYNAKCNLSLVIYDIFYCIKIHENDQVIDHTNGLSKYVCKYIGKFDEGN